MSDQLQDMLADFEAKQNSYGMAKAQRDAAASKLADAQAADIAANKAQSDAKQAMADAAHALESALEAAIQ